MQQTSSQFQYSLRSKLSSIRLSILRNYFHVETLISKPRFEKDAGGNLETDHLLL